MSIKDILSIANDHLVMEPLGALGVACAIVGATINAPLVHFDDSMGDICRSITYGKREYYVSFCSHELQWGEGWIDASERV